MRKLIEIPERSDGQTGLTLMELIVVLGLTVIVVVIILLLHTIMFKSSLGVKGATDLQRQVKIGAMHLEKHLELAGFKLPEGSNTFTTMDSNMIKFSYVDLLNRHCVNSETVSVKYSVQDGNILKQELQCKTSDPSYKDVIVANKALALKFEYFDINRNETSTSDEVEVVKYGITVQQKNNEAFLKDRKVESEVQIKNN